MDKLNFSLIEISEGAEAQSYLEEIEEANRDEDNVSFDSIKIHSTTSFYKTI